MILMLTYAYQGSSWNGHDMSTLQYSIAWSHFQTQHKRLEVTASSSQWSWMIMDIKMENQETVVAAVWWVLFTATATHRLQKSWDWKLKVLELTTAAGKCRLCSLLWPVSGSWRDNWDNWDKWCAVWEIAASYKQWRNSFECQMSKFTH